MNHSVRRLFAATTSLAIVGAISLALMPQMTPSAQATFPGYNGKLLFYTHKDGTYQIYSMNPDGSQPVHLTPLSSNSGGATWSPDGTKIALGNDQTGNYDIYTMDQDGRNMQRLTTDTHFENSPTWSPDGHKIAFSRSRDTTTYRTDLWVMNADGTGQSQLTFGHNGDTSPSWSPDSAYIAWQCNINTSNYGICRSNSDGTDIQLLTHDTFTSQIPRWSPDGKKIVFTSNRDGDNEIYTMNVDGSDQRRLTNDPANDNETFWAPDGRTIAFKSNRAGVNGIYLMNLDGSGQTAITQPPDDAGGPDWQPIPNTTPITAPDTISLQANTFSIKDVLANDTDEETLSGSNLTIKTNPTHGSAVIVDGKVKYTPAKDYVGSDSLTYQICDSFMLDQKCSTATLGITIQAPTPSPTATPGPIPTIPTITSIGAVQTNGASTIYYTSHRPTFSGTAAPDASIIVEIHSDPIILTTTADSSGHWSVTPDQDIPDGQHTVNITATKDEATSQVLAFTLVIDPAYVIPNTGADTTALRFIGLSVLIAGGGIRLYRRRAGQASSILP